MTADTDVLEVPYEIADHYSYSYGGISRFFESIVEDEQLLGADCPSCEKVYCPPRPHCPDCLEETGWTELEGTGTIKAAVDTYYVPKTHDVNDFFTLPHVLALIQLDGADNELMHIVVPEGHFEADAFSRGDRVEVGFREEREGFINDIFFTPLE